MKIILAVNAGSSSVKVSVYEIADGHAEPMRVAEAQISGLTAPPPKLTYKRRGGDGDDVTVRKDDSLGGDSDGDSKIGSQAAAFERILRELFEDEGLPQLASKSDIAVVAHRIVHGGDAERPEHITAETLHKLEKLSDLAPLHNGPSLAIVRACMSSSSSGGGGGDELPSSPLAPGVVNVACFDTVFHASIPRHIRTYPIDQTVARANGLRKYGFHGLSYAYVTRAVSAFLGRDPSGVGLIALHLGSGASACAIRGGRSHDTSMGLTPLAGLPGATRSGSVDPSLVFHYASDVGRLSPNSTKELHISRAEEILNKEAGWKALTGTTDFGAIAAAKEEGGAGGDDGDGDGDEGADARRLAFDLVVDRICGFVGSYYVSLRGRVDALVFAGGIGEKSAPLRRAVVDQCRCLGFELDEARNAAPALGAAAVADVGRDGARHRVLVCQTDEQFEMARWCAEDGTLWV
ncbi:hypothetical protein RB595_001009 [Gaeumannomyces hyphopodioides]